MALTEAEELELLELEEAESLSQAEPEISKTESAIRGAIQGIPAIGTWADEITGAVESAAGSFGLVPDKTYEQARDESREAYRKAQEANPGSYMGGMAIPMVASSIPKSIPVLGTAASGILGAIEGAGASENEDLRGIAQDAAISSGVSAGTAGLGNLAMRSLRSKAPKVIEGISDSLKETAERQSARVQGLERGTAKKLGDRRARQIGRQGLDDKIVTMGADTDDMIARNKALKEMAMGERNKVYDVIDETGVSNFNPVDVAIDLEGQVGNFNRMSPLNRGRTKKLEDTLDSVMQRGGDNISMREAQNLMEELRSAAKWSGVGNRTPEEELAQSAYHHVRKALNESAEKSADEVGISGLREMIESANRKYSIAKDADKILSNKQAREQGNRLFGLTDSIIAAGSLGYGTSTGDWGSAATPLLIKKGMDKYGAKSLALGADKLSNILRAAPERLGRYSDVLHKASQRGGNALGVTDYMLQQNDPEYRELKRQLDEE